MSGASKSMKYRLDRLIALEECEKTIAALRIAVRTLEWYADRSHWSENDWGVRAVIDPPDYGDAGKKARNAIKRIEKELG